MSLADRDIIRYSNRYSFEGNPIPGICTPTGIAGIGPMTPGRWVIHSRIECYFKRGASTVAAADVLVDETAPSTSQPIAANAYIPIDVTGSTDNYVAFKSKSGGDTGLVFLMCQAPTEGY